MPIDLIIDVLFRGEQVTTENVAKILQQTPSAVWIIVLGLIFLGPTGINQIVDRLLPPSGGVEISEVKEKLADIKSHQQFMGRRIDFLSSAMSESAVKQQAIANRIDLLAKEISSKDDGAK